MFKKFIIIILVICIANVGCKLTKTIYESEFKSESLSVSDNDLRNSVWISHVSGIQCETTYFSCIESATDFLTSSEILVLDSKESHTMALAACGKPNGLYFVVRIKNSDIERAENLGWRLLNKDQIERFKLN